MIRFSRNDSLINSESMPPAGGFNFTFKGTVHPKMRIVSSFTHPGVVPNLYECVCSAEHKGGYSEESL